MPSGCATILDPSLGAHCAGVLKVNDPMPESVGPADGATHSNVPFNGPSRPWSSSLVPPPRGQNADSLGYTADLFGLALVVEGRAAVSASRT